MSLLQFDEHFFAIHSCSNLTEFFFKRQTVWQSFIHSAAHHVDTSINHHKSGLGKQQNSIGQNWIIRFGEWQPCVFFGGCCNFFRHIIFRPPKYD